MAAILFFLSAYLFVIGWSFHTGFYNELSLEASSIDVPWQTIVFSNWYYLVDSTAAFVSSTGLVTSALIIFFSPDVISRIIGAGPHKFLKTYMMSYPLPIMLMTLVLIVSTALMSFSDANASGERSAKNLVSSYRLEESVNPPVRKFTPVRLRGRSDFEDKEWSYPNSKNKIDLYLIDHGSSFLFVLVIPHDEDRRVMALRIPNDAVQSISSSLSLGR